ncbi:glycosyl transferase [Rhizocola hellebori]|uniref:Glycosyl transferase n=1 Tax=Rhizocola hellebori TaxID=1392758 RepID=A0A8J3VLU6_9ACTN|nr:bifunctional glycosyltransferase family 2 protein/CDP-glycerol:glycerophosphate glycerophosphotransferase [Rhizocola hellebori]GIH10481.1 glycosyl transferase [Rhizocola hellebori]
MPLISIVVPIYGVEPYLRPCLDSILAQGFTDFELIAVDDSSPDHCGEIIDEYAAADRRVRPLHLEANVGLGLARNAGFELARGDYTWFVDSDDWLAQGALSAIAQRLAATRPDVLMVDYARAHLDGSTKRNRKSHLFTDAPAAPFRIEDYPKLLENYGVAWNKLVRTDFLRQARIPFPPGWYEDVPFTYPVLAKANSIAVLDQICVYYRQRRRGSILGTCSARHIELFDQYELALSRLEEGTVKDYLRPFAVDHGVLVLNAKGRLPGSARRVFFRRLAEFKLQHGVRTTRWKQRFLFAGGWRWYPQIKKVVKARPRTGALRRKLRRLPGLLYYRWQRRLPLENLAVYSSYWGRAYECNPAAIHAKAQELVPGVRSVWVVRPDQVARMPAGVEHVVRGSFAYYRVMARAKWFIYNDGLEGEIVKRPGTIHLQTHHGTPLKHMGVDEPGINVEKLLKRCDRWDFNLSSNKYSTETWERAYPCRFETLEYGAPRNDVLVNAPTSGQGIVLYAPTFRRGLRPPVIHGVNVVVKHHYFDEKIPQPSITALMLSADVLITDYSSVMFDFALLDRPIVIYAPDWEHYVRTRGVYFDLLKEPPGLVTTTEEELQRGFDSGEVWAYDERRRAFRERFCQFDDGKAAERVVRRIFLGEKPW